MSRKSAPAKNTRKRSDPTPEAIEVSIDDFVELNTATPPPLAPALQRRRFTRVPYVTLARLVHGEERAIARVEDVSEAGMRFRSTLDIASGALVEVHCALPITGEPVAFRATVRWRSVVGDQIVLGVQFEPLDESIRHALVRYVSVMSSFGEST